MRTTSFLIVLLWGFWAAIPSAASQTFPAWQIDWRGTEGLSKDVVGVPDEYTNTLFLLLAQENEYRIGTLPNSVVDSVVYSWLKEHPKAVVIPVAAWHPPKSGAVVYAWVVQGTNNLNIELVRRGCVSPQTQMLLPHEKLVIPQKDYDAFIQKVAHVIPSWKPKEGANKE